MWGFTSRKGCATLPALNESVFIVFNSDASREARKSYEKPDSHPARGGFPF